MAKQPQKISSRNRRSLTRLALLGMKDPTKLTFAQQRRLATVVYKQMLTAEEEARKPRARR